MKMRHNWALVVAVLFMICAGAGERLSAVYVHNLQDKDKALIQRAGELRARADGAAVERKRYEEIDHLATLIQDQVQWESDSTVVMRSFGDIAARLGVKLLESRTQALSGQNAVVAGGAYQRMRIEARLVGSFWGLLQYVDAIERSAQPMAVESLSMSADRDKAGAGDLRMTVSALSPAPSVAGSGATTGGTR
jgi:hypothetical protein